MDFTWTDEQLKLREEIIRFARKELDLPIKELDSKEEFNLEGWRRCSDYGILGFPIPQKYGGGEFDALTTASVLEALGYGCRDNGLLMSIHAHMWGCQLPLLLFGTEPQKKKYLPHLCKGEVIGALAISEQEAGSDAYSLQATAECKGDHYLLNGTKMFVTNAPIADLVIFFANLYPSKGWQGITAFLVQAQSPGFSVRRKIAKMGIRTAPMGELVLESCEVPKENRLGEEGAGTAIFNSAMEWERGYILTGAIGSMERILEICINYSKKRHQFGQPIGKFQLIASKIVDMKVRLETSRLLLYKTAWLKNQGRSAFMEASMSKLHISECWVQTCMDAIQLHGGYGYLTDLELERELRDAMASRLYSGTSEFQRTFIARLLGL
jgi:alkylation response protein AidB-like acyl-CoA dehydrogenase